MSKKKVETPEVDDFDDIEETTDEVEEEVVEKKPAEKAAKKGKGDVFTYVGGGADSPRKIMFMGRQEFVRGKATEVTDPTVLAKVKTNPCFTDGKVSEEDLHDIDEAAAKAEAKQQKVNKEIDASFKKRHG